MAAGRMVIAGWMPALDANGLPIPNAQMYFYENNTTTLATVYANSSLTTPLANPVLANSSGQFPEIWADDANLFSVTIDAPYGPPGQPFSFNNIGPATSANNSGTNKADRDGSNIEVLPFRGALGYGTAALLNVGTGPAQIPALGGDGKLPSSVLPENGSYQGSWDASTNTPEIVSGEGTNGDFYYVSVAGTTVIDGYPADPMTQQWEVGDQIRFSSELGAWQRIAAAAPGRNLGGWDASLNVPEIQAGVGIEGDFYTVIVEGTQDIGGGATEWRFGDQALFQEGAWIKTNTAATPDSVQRALDDAVVVRVKALLDEMPYTPLEFGATQMEDAGDDVDVSVPLQAMIDASLPGLPSINLRGKFYVNKPIYLKPGVVLQGGAALDRPVNYFTDDYFGYWGIIVLGPQGRIIGMNANGCGLNRVVVVSEDAVGPRPSTQSAALTAVEKWWTDKVTALTFIDSHGVTIRDSIVVGFKRAAMFTGCERPIIDTFRCDTHAGVEIRSLLDVGRVDRLHAWGFWVVGSNFDWVLTRRRGSALRVSEVVDGVTCYSALNYGHLRGIDVDGRNWVKVTMTNAGSGYTSPPTVTISGGSTSGVTAYAVLNQSGGVAAVIVDEPGTVSGSTGPTISFSGGGGSGAAATGSIETGSIYASLFHGFWIDNAISITSTGHQAIGIHTRGQVRQVTFSDTHIDGQYDGITWEHTTNSVGAVTDSNVTCGIVARYKRRFVSGDGVSLNFNSGGNSSGEVATNRVENTAGTWSFGTQQSIGTAKPLFSIQAGFDRSRFAFHDGYDSNSGGSWDTFEWDSTVRAIVANAQTVPSATNTLVAFNSKPVDSLGDFDTGSVNRSFLARKRGAHMMSLAFSLVPSGNGAQEIMLYKAGVLYRRLWRITETAGNALADTVCWTEFCEVGDQFQVIIYSENGCSIPAPSGSTPFWEWKIYRLPSGRG